MKFTNYQRVAVRAFIENSKGETLFVQRAMNDSFPGKWELPGGGLDFDETAHDGVRREVFEETGIDLQVLHPIFTHTSSSEHNGAERQLVWIIFYCKPIDEAQQVKLSHEHMDYRWVPIAKYKEFESPEFFEKIVKIKDILYAKPDKA